MAVRSGSGSRVLIDETTKNPRHGWVRMMRTVLKAQLGDPREAPTWQERVPFYGNLKRWFRSQTPTPTPNERYKWQNHAYLQIHSLARKIDAKGGGGMLGHWGGVKLYHLVCSCSAKKSELTGQHKCPHHLLREMACLRVGQQRTGRKVLMLPILREACLEFGRQLPLCYA